MGQTEGTPINKGNYSLEPDWRIELFEKYRGEGWEKEYKEYRKNWEECAKNKVVLDYPLCVDIELSTLCNLKCPMCFTIMPSFQNRVERKFMQMELFQKIIDEIAGKVPSVRLSLRGESTLHPQFVECIKYAKKKEIPEISFLTNCSTMEPEFFEEILMAGADWITLSIDGLDEEYEKIRKPLKFQDTLQKVKCMKVIKDKYGVHKPVIKIQSIWPAIKNEPERFYQTFKPYVDFVAFNPLIDFSSEDSVCIENFSCPQIYQRILIAASGKALRCSNDEEETFVVGDANVESIHEIWHGKALNWIREQHSKSDGFKTVPKCKSCYIPRKTDDSEKTVVEGREIIIQNYRKEGV